MRRGQQRKAFCKRQQKQYCRDTWCDDSVTFEQTTSNMCQQAPAGCKKHGHRRRCTKAECQPVHIAALQHKVRVPHMTMVRANPLIHQYFLVRTGDIIFKQQPHSCFLFTVVFHPLKNPRGLCRRFLVKARGSPLGQSRRTTDTDADPSLFGG